MAGGDFLTLLGSSDEGLQFCCGYLVVDSDTVGCAHNQSSFTIGTARLMYGYAALENSTFTSDVNDSSATDTSTALITMASTTASTTSSSSADRSCQDDNTTIGVGVGVPLGVIALLAVAWGFWERRRRVRTQTTAAAAADGGSLVNHQQASHSYYDKWQVPGGGHMQPAQQAGLEVAELRARSSPVEMAETVG